MVQKNKRIMDILDFIDKFRTCDITHVSRLYFKEKYPQIHAQKKLTSLVNEKTLCRKRNDINSKYYYWLPDRKPPAQIHHKLLLVEFYVKLCERLGMNNVDCKPEYTGLSGIRPDAFIKAKYNNRTYLFFVEIQTSNNPTDTEKYEKAYQTNIVDKVFPAGIFPTIIFISDKMPKVSSKNLNFIFLGYDINIDLLLKNIL